MKAEIGFIELDNNWKTTIPRMVGETDVEVLRTLGTRLSDSAKILEIGCWLGGLSQHLSRFGRLEVVDHFIWSEANDLRHPGILEKGETFLPQFRELARLHGFEADVHQADYRKFIWQGGPLDLVVVDAPRSANDLLAALRGLGNGLTDQTLIAIKNGLNLAYPGMMGLVELLTGKGILRMADSGQPRWCNLAVLAAGTEIAALEDVNLTVALMAETPLAREVKDPWDGYSLAVARLAHVGISTSNWAGALSLLEGLPRDIEALYAWDATEAALDPEETPDLLGFAEALRFHCDPALPPQGPAVKALATSATVSLRHYFTSLDNDGIAWGCLLFALGDVYRSEASGWLALPAEIAERVRGKTVAEFTSNPALSGIAYMIAGARGYLGTSPEGEDANELVMGDLSSDYDLVINASRDTFGPDLLARGDADPRLTRAMQGLLRRIPPND
jgi:hypothetical protein